MTITHGLPVTTIERTVTDLVEARTDLSLVADVVRDAAQTRRLDTNRLKELLGPLAAVSGGGGLSVSRTLRHTGRSTCGS